MALKNVNPNVNDQTIVLQPIMKSSILDDNVLPNELNTVPNNTSIHQYFSFRSTFVKNCDWV